MKTLKLLVRLSRPLFLAGGFVLYALGVSIATYLGKSIDWNAYFLGQAWVTLLQLSVHYLNEYYDTAADQSNENRTFLTGGSGALGPDGLPPRTALMAGLGCLAVLASLTVFLIGILNPQPAVYMIMIVAFLGAFFYSVPPLKLESSGYGELVVTLLVAFLLPAFGFNLQTGGFHRLLAMTSFPLASLLMAMLLAFELPDFPNDLKFQKRTLLVRLGWQNGMGLHNILVFTAYLLLLIARFFGYPQFAMFAGLLTLPLGIFQIWQMRSIAVGAKPNWNALTIGALALFSLSAYLFTYAFWVN